MASPFSVLHVAGSTEDKYWTNVAMMYAKAALTFPGRVKAYYAVVNPDSQWFYCEDSLDGVEVDDICGGTPPKRVQGPMPLRGLLELLEAIPAGSKPDVVVPHMFDIKGMTAFRGFFEDLLGCTVVGPDLFANVVAQNKAYTRDVLKGAGIPVPDGQLLLRAPVPQGASFEELVQAFGIKLAPPFVVKPILEDNSRGVSLVMKPEAAVLEKALAEAFAFPSADRILIEEFIPGREIRCGTVETLEGLRAVPAMVEYVMNKDMPIRTVTDKIQSAADGSGMKQTKCERVIPADIDADLNARIRGYAARAHSALGSKDYSLFDFRVHEETGEAYIIEACMFWSFSPISAISLLVNASQTDQFGDARWPMTLEDTVLSCWQNAALRNATKRPTSFNNLKASDEGSTTASE